MRPKNKTPLFVDAARANLIASVVALEFSLPQAGIIGAGKGTSDRSYARHIAMYMMYCVFGTTKSRIAEVFGRHVSTVSHACKAVEDQRDDPVFDRKLIDLENRLNRFSNASKTGAAV